MLRLRTQGSGLILGTTYFTISGAMRRAVKLREGNWVLQRGERCARVLVPWGWGATAKDDGRRSCRGGSDE